MEFKITTDERRYTLIKADDKAMADGVAASSI